MIVKPLISVLLAGGLLLCHAGCSESAQEPAAGASVADVSEPEQPAVPAHEPDADPSEPAHDERPEPATPSDPSMCATVPASDLTAITGAEYATTNSTANFSTIRHCEYFAEDMKYSASLLIAFDALAAQRMELNRQVPGIVAVADLGDDAIWEPAQGALTVLDGNRCAEVRLSTSHGDDATRRSMTIKIANLIFDRY